MGSDHEHRVCTHREAEAAIRAHEEFFVYDCFCRTPAREGKAAWEYCGHPVDTCLGFRTMRGEEMQAEYREVTKEQALRMFEDWRKQGNFFRFMVGEDWLCFCCGCGCGWFRDENGNRKQDSCDKSPYLEKTDPEKCSACGTCVDVCAYDARTLNGTLAVEAEKCWGCEACVPMCPEDAIVLVPRGS